MTLQELVDKLNTVNPHFIHAEYNDDLNRVEVLGRKANYILTLSPYEKDANDFDMYHDNLNYGPYTIYRLLKPIMEYINTPIEERDIPKRNVYVLLEGHMLLTEPDSDCPYITWLDLNSIVGQSNKNLMQCIDDNGCSIPNSVWDSIKDDWDKCNIDEFYNKEDVIDQYLNWRAGRCSYED